MSSIVLPYSEFSSLPQKQNQAYPFAAKRYGSGVKSSKRHAKKNTIGGNFWGENVGTMPKKTTEGMGWGDFVGSSATPASMGNISNANTQGPTPQGSGVNGYGFWGTQVGSAAPVQKPATESSANIKGPGDVSGGSMGKGTWKDLNHGQYAATSNIDPMILNSMHGGSMHGGSMGRGFGHGFNRGGSMRGGAYGHGYQDLDGWKQSSAALPEDIIDVDDYENVKGETKEAKKYRIAQEKKIRKEMAMERNAAQLPSPYQAQWSGVYRGARRGKRGMKQSKALKSARAKIRALLASRK
jgi:hypothetical protein